MNDTIAAPALDYTVKSGEALQQAALLAEAVHQEGVKVAAATPGLVDQLVAAGLIDVSEKTAAAQKISSHTGSLELLQNLLNIRSTEHADFNQKLAAAGGGHAVAAPVAQPARTKDASAHDYSSGGYVGRQRGAGEVDDASRAMAQALGIPVG